MRLALLIALMVLAAAAGAAELWRWVDDKGVVHYSDRPVPGAVKINVGSAQTYGAEAASGSAEGEDVAGEDGETGPEYRRLAIARPGQEETFWNIEGRLDVQVEVDPVIRGNHELRLFLDGQRVQGLPPDATSVTLGNVFRGEHSLVATIVDGTGQEIASSEPVRFFVRQTSIQNPNNPNAPPPVNPLPGRPGGG